MKRFWKRCLGFLDRFQRRPPKYRVTFTEELPERLRPHILYAIGEGTPWLAALICPCGCGDVIHLSLLERDSPRWSLREESDGTMTISPSVWRSKGCKSHFIVRKGAVMWCEANRGRTSRSSKRR
jgi:uncharacterized protein DUF6527